MIRVNVLGRAHDVELAAIARESPARATGCPTLINVSTNVVTKTQCRVDLCNAVCRNP